MEGDGRLAEVQARSGGVDRLGPIEKARVIEVYSTCTVLRVAFFAIQIFFVVLVPSLNIIHQMGVIKEKVAKFWSFYTLHTREGDKSSLYHPKPIPRSI